MKTAHNSSYRNFQCLGYFLVGQIIHRPHKQDRGILAGKGSDGLNETVDEPAPPSFDHRIDMIFTRPAPGEQVRVIAGEVTGNQSADKDPVTGLWPSDHAGVVLTVLR